MSDHEPIPAHRVGVRVGAERLSRGLLVSGWAVLVAVAPLVFSPSAAATFFTAKLMPLYAGAFLLALGALLRERAATAEPSHVSSGASRWTSGRVLGGFLGLGLASVALASSPITGLIGVYNQGTGWLFWAASITVFVSLASFGSRKWERSTLHVLLWVSVAAAGVVAALAVLQALGYEPLRFRLGFRVDGRAGSTFGNPLFSGAYLALMLVVGLDFARRAQVLLSRLGWLAVVALLILGIGFSWSRGAWLALAAGVVVWAGLTMMGAYVEGDRRVGVAWLASMIASVVVWSLLVALLIVPQSAPSRGIALGTPGIAADAGGTSTVETRLLMWRTSIAAARDRPLLGWGPNNLRYGSQLHVPPEKLELEPLTRDADAHSLPFEIVATWGLPAGLLLAAWFISLARDVVRLRRGSFAAMAGGVLAGFVVASLTMPQNHVVTPVALALVAVALTGDGQAVSVGGARPRESTRTAWVLALGAAAALMLAGTMGAAAWYSADRHFLVGTIRDDDSELDAAAHGFPLADDYWRVLGAARTREGMGQGRPLLVDEGIADLERGLRLAPRNIDLLTTLTSVRLQRGEWVAARGRAEEAVSYAPTEPMPHAQLAYALLRVGEVERGREEAELALAVDVRSARVLYTVGLFFRESGDLGRARESFERALEIDPRFEPARVELTRLP